jgi:hypothetical protein
MKIRVAVVMAASMLAGCAPRATVLNPIHAGREPAPGGTVVANQPYEITVPPSLLGQKGTCALWIKLDEAMAKKVGRTQVITSDALEFFLDARGTSTFVLWHIIGKMNGRGPDGEARLFWIGAEMTHLDAGRWYHVAFVWDAEDPERNGVFVDGIRQADNARYAYPGQVRPAGRPIEMRIGAPGVMVSALNFYEDSLDETMLRRICQSAGHTGYTDEGLRFSGQRFVPQDVDRDHPVYRTEFDDPAELANWKLEGGYEASIDNGRLVLTTSPPEGEARHLVYWLTRQMPADYLLEFEFKPADRHKGLAIVFLNARGVHGESIFDEALAPRDGTFRQYTNGDVNSYHISYWAGGRGSANVRKNSGFHLVAIGKDLVWTDQPDSFQKISVYKRGGLIRLMVDDVVSVEFDDDGKTYGPVHPHAGWIGLRQMAHTGSAAYERLAVYPLTP